MYPKSKLWKFKASLHGVVRGVNLKHLDANVVGAELDRLNARDGRVDPDVLVEEQRPTDAPLHRAFEWDDVKCGQAHRRTQAQALITAVVEVEPRDEEFRYVAKVVSDTVEVPAYLHVPTMIMDTPQEVGEAYPLPQGAARKGAYYPRASVLGDEKQRRYVVRRALADFLALKARHAGLVEFARVFDEIDNLARSFEVLAVLDPSVDTELAE